jgi:regulator of protease activity HflC (stomatin/prohibitin superfamily)
MRKFFSFALIAVLAFASTSCWDFNRMQREKDAESHGRAILLEAESSKKAAIEEAKASNESATLQAEAKVKIAKAEAQAEIERARGVAEANKIIGQSLQGNQEYLKYLMIQNMGHGKGERIYIATEAGLPILEAK